jgi:hypothetical protein
MQVPGDGPRLLIAPPSCRAERCWHAAAPAGTQSSPSALAQWVSSTSPSVGPRLMWYNEEFGDWDVSPKAEPAQASRASRPSARRGAAQGSTARPPLRRPPCQTACLDAAAAPAPRGGVSADAPAWPAANAPLPAFLSLLSLPPQDDVLLYGGTAAEVLPQAVHEPSGWRLAAEYQEGRSLEASSLAEESEYMLAPGLLVSRTPFLRARCSHCRAPLGARGGAGSGG